MGIIIFIGGYVIATTIWLLVQDSIAYQTTGQKIASIIQVISMVAIGLFDIMAFLTWIGFGKDAWAMFVFAMILTLCWVIYSCCIQGIFRGNED